MNKDIDNENIALTFSINVTTMKKWCHLKIFDVLQNTLVETARWIQLPFGFFQKAFERSFLAVHTTKTLRFSLLAGA